jgi:hypothetical protein
MGIRETEGKGGPKKVVGTSGGEEMPGGGSTLFLHSGKLAAWLLLLEKILLLTLLLLLLLLLMLILLLLPQLEEEFVNVFVPVPSHGNKDDSCPKSTGVVYPLKLLQDADNDKEGVDSTPRT